MEVFISNDLHIQAPGWGTLLFRCKPGPGGEACAGSTGEEWLPGNLCAEAQTPPARAGWGTASTNICNHPIHPRVVPVYHRVLSHLDIRVAFCPLRTLRQELVHPKDPVPEWWRKGVVYTIPCDQCPRCYVGQTGRCLEKRLAEHCRAVTNGMCWPWRLLSMCSYRATKWTCPRPG